MSRTIAYELAHDALPMLDRRAMHSWPDHTEIGTYDTPAAAMAAFPAHDFERRADYRTENRWSAVRPDSEPATCVVIVEDTAT